MVIVLSWELLIFRWMISNKLLQRQKALKQECCWFWDEGKARSRALGTADLWEAVRDERTGCGTGHPKGGKETTGSPAGLDYVPMLNHLQCEVMLSQQLLGVSPGPPSTSGCTIIPSLSSPALSWEASVPGSQELQDHQELNDRRKEEKERQRWGFCLSALTQNLTFWRPSW